MKRIDKLMEKISDMGQVLLRIPQELAEIQQAEKKDWIELRDNHYINHDQYDELKAVKINLELEYRELLSWFQAADIYLPSSSFDVVEQQKKILKILKKNNDL